MDGFLERRRQRRCYCNLKLQCVTVTLTLCLYTSCQVAAGIAEQPDDYSMLKAYTKVILGIEASVVAQAIRIPNSIFQSSPCHAVYLGNPDWTRVHVDVDFVAGALTRKYEADGSVCTQQAYATYIDGYGAPDGVSGVHYSTKKASWGAMAIIDPSSVNTSASPIPIAELLEPLSGEGSGGADGSGGGEAAANSTLGSGRRRQLGFQFPVGRSSFGSHLDDLRDDTSGLLRLFTDESDGTLPGPDSVLARPVLAASYYQRKPPIVDIEDVLAWMEAGVRASGSEDVDPSQLSGEFPASILTGASKVYRAPVADCLAAMAGDVGRGGGGVSFGHPVPPHTQTSRASCYVTQLVVYVYNNCTIPREEVFAAAASPDATDSTPSSPGNATKTNTNTNTNTTGTGSAAFTGSRKLSCIRGSRLRCMLAKSVEYEAAELSYNEADGYVELLLQYQPYSECYDKGVEFFSKLVTKVLIGSAIAIAILIAILTLPTVVRLFILFPARCVAYLFRLYLVRQRHGDPPLLPPRLDRHRALVAGGGWGGRSRVLAALLWPRRQLVYAIASVHSPNGQYRSLMVSVLSSVVLAISLSAYPPHVDPPLDYYIPPLAFQITSDAGRTRSIMHFLDIILVSTFMGTIGYMALLANFNTPTNRYYAVQCVLSGLFLLLLDVVVVLQITSVLYYWDVLNPGMTYLPMAVFQLANLLLANVLQVVLFFSRRERNDARRERTYQQLMAQVAARQRQRATPGRAHVAGLLHNGGAPLYARPSLGPMGPYASGTETEAAAVVLAAREGAVNGNLGAVGNGHQRELDWTDGQGGGLKEERGGQGRSSWAGVQGMDQVVQTKGASWEGVRRRSRTGQSQDGRGSEAGGAAAGAGGVLEEPEGKVYRASGSGHGSEVAAAATGGGWRGGKAAALLRRALAPVREDDAFKYPAWFLAAVLIAGYMVVFTYGRAVYWSDSIADCIEQPSDCINDVAGRYLLFVSRLASREEQQALLAQLQMAWEGLQQVAGQLTAQEGANQTAPLPGVVTSAVAAADLPGRVARQVGSLDFDRMLAAALNRSGVDPSSLPPDAAVSLRAQVMAAVQSTVNASLTSESDMLPLSQALQAQLVNAVNGTVNGISEALQMVTDRLGNLVRVEDQLVSWRDGLSTRFRACAVVGFTLGLCLGIFSLVYTAVAFRRAVRQVKMARLAYRIYGRTRGLQGYTGDRGAGSSLKQHRDSGQDGDGDGDGDEVPFAGGLLADPDSVVNRSLQQKISIMVIFTGVLLSIAIVQLYAVGVLLSVGLALLTHPWLWTWLVPRYYFVVVGIAVVYACNRIFLVMYVGDLYLSDGHRIFRPAAYVAYIVIASAANLVFGLLLAVVRIAILVVTTIFAVGRIDITIFTYFKGFDLSHNAFLAAVHLYDAMSDFADPIYLPGPRGRAHRRWRLIRDTVRQMPSSELQRLMSPDSSKTGKEWRSKIFRWKSGSGSKSEPATPRSPANPFRDPKSEVGCSSNSSGGGSGKGDGGGGGDGGVGGRGGCHGGVVGGGGDGGDGSGVGGVGGGGSDGGGGSGGSDGGIHANNVGGGGGGGVGHHARAQAGGAGGEVTWHASAAYQAPDGPEPPASPRPSGGPLRQDPHLHDTG